VTPEKAADFYEEDENPDYLAEKLASAMKTDDKFGERSCDETFTIGHAVLRCNAVYHTRYADNPANHYDPFWGLAWQKADGKV
jgi:hypothetical protein